jgi:CelD/BcsL family acetyltransferase involved in cellulose biosynthesis
MIPVVSPAPRDAWQAVLQVDPYALETQSPAWTDAMCDGGAYEDASRCYEVGGRVMVLPMLRRRLGGLLAVDAANPLQCGAGGLLAPGGPTTADTAMVFQDLAERRLASQSVWPNPILAAKWAASVPASAHVVPRIGHMLDLEGGFDHVWMKKFEGSARTGARKAEREGVEVECDTTGRLVPEMHQMLEDSVARWARLQHEPLWLAARRQKARDPLERFQSIARHLGDRCRVWIARVEGRPAACLLVLLGANAYDFRAAMNEDLKRYRAQDLIERLAVEEACQAGCRYYYMGDSGSSRSLGRYKEQFGALPYRYAEYRLERLPILAGENVLKSVIKRAIRFRD